MLVVQNAILDYESANFTENETAWSSGSTYNYTDEARDGHFIYKYAGEDGTNTIESPSTDTTNKWVKSRPTNYYAMLDGKTSTQTINSDNIEISISDLNYDTIALLELDATSVELVLTDNSTSDVVYSETIDLVNNDEIVDYYSYCFGDFIRDIAVYRRLPIYGNAVLEISINNPSDTAKCGRLVCGRSFYVGNTGYGINVNLESYSRKITDEFGQTTLTHRDSVNLDSYEVLVPTSKVPQMIRKAKELDAVPVLFVTDEKETSNINHLLNYGYWENFSILIPNPVKSTVSLTVKGII